MANIQHLWAAVVMMFFLVMVVMYANHLQSKIITKLTENVVVQNKINSFLAKECTPTKPEEK